ncbi:lysophospholipase [Aurantimonas sp. MSK8Z-1]|uniref:alpha/beta fold hydrolase n=1 Tax=Mangrovibrevibacter kandeliae TaxID=2968473 RepID=UPI002119962C|nr:alpha/beta fold hydrolase [Aurantimonas sp. MSK8Z-1]MCW4116650.1 lysophospholipase [Aurantimonas sp. MSK8Z-1]
MPFDKRLTLDSPTGAALNLYVKHPAGQPRAILVVHHGLAEHAGRYHRFAEAMAAAGLAVYAHDHRGHGSTTAPGAPLRSFGRQDSLKRLLADAAFVLTFARSEWIRRPTILFGHSMGAATALALACDLPEAIAGAALWNYAAPTSTQRRAALAALSVEQALKGSDVASAVMARATFDAWAKAVEPRETAFDWLSHDPSAVAAYRNDPLCGWSPTVGLWRDLMRLYEQLSAAPTLDRLPHDLPLHLLAGSGDPVTERGESVHRLAGALRHTGLRDVALEPLADARHETLNEVEAYRAPALRGLTAWIDRVLAAQPVAPAG